MWILFEACSFSVYFITVLLLEQVSKYKGAVYWSFQNGTKMKSCMQREKQWVFRVLSSTSPITIKYWNSSHLRTNTYYVLPKHALAHVQSLYSLN